MEFLVQYPYLLVPLIFIARVSDVSLGTFRTIVIFRGHKFLASFIVSVVRLFETGGCLI